MTRAEQQANSAKILEEVRVYIEKFPWQTNQQIGEHFNLHRFTISRYKAKIRLLEEKH